MLACRIPKYLICQQLNSKHGRTMSRIIRKPVSTLSTLSTWTAASVGGNKYMYNAPPLRLRHSAPLRTRSVKGETLHLAKHCTAQHCAHDAVPMYSDRGNLGHNPLASVKCTQVRRGSPGLTSIKNVRLGKTYVLFNEVDDFQVSGSNSVSQHP